MNTLFDLDTIPTVEPETKLKAKPQFYLRAMSGGSWWFLWKTHTNGDNEWERESELTINGGKKKPLRYNTLSGAKRMLSIYVGGDVPKEVAVWNEAKKS